MNRPHASRPGSLLLLAGLAAVALGGSGCDELKSRGEIQEGNRLYLEGHYEKSVEKFDSALQRTPSLIIGHHNAGLAYYKLFSPGVETPANTAAAQKAAEHFTTYLEAYPTDRKVISLLTTLWLDSGQYDKALTYWGNVLAKDPNSLDVMDKLANINRQAGKYDEALKWHEKRVQLETSKSGKLKAYLDIAQMEWSRLQKAEMVDSERLAVVDLGIAALQKAEALDPDQAQVQSLMGSLYQHRAFAHQAAWARAVESASQRYHQVRFTEIKKKEQAAAQNAPAPAPTPGASTANPPPAPK